MENPTHQRRSRAKRTLPDVAPRSSRASARPRRTVRKARRTGQELALKHLEACTSAYDEEYGDGWGAKSGKPVHSIKSRRKFIKDAYETVCDEVDKAPEFFYDDEIALKAILVLRDGFTRQFPGAEIMQDSERDGVARMSADALMTLFRFDCHKAAPGWEKKDDIVTDVGALFVSRLREVAQRGKLANGGSVPKRDATKPKELVRISEAVHDLMVFCSSASDSMHVGHVADLLQVLRHARERIREGDLSSVPKSKELRPGLTASGVLEDIEVCLRDELRVEAPAEEEEDSDSEDESGDEDNPDSDWEGDVEEEEEEEEEDFDDLVSEGDAEEEAEEIRRGREADAELVCELATDEEEDSFEYEDEDSGDESC